MRESRRSPQFVLSVIMTTAAVACTPPAPPDADLVVTGGTLIDPTRALPTRADIFIRDGVFTAIVEPGSVPIPSDARVLDASGQFVIPGLADMHVHFSLGTPGARLDDETEEVLRRLLHYGVTTVLNTGATDGSTESIRELWARQEAGDVLAPTVYGTGGHLTLPGTHPVWTIFPDRVREAAEAILDNTPPEEPADLYPLGIGISLVRTSDAARQAVRERAEGGMHAIKITVETGPTEFGDDHPMMPVELIRAIVDEAAQFELPVFAHVSSPDELEAVLAGGAAGVVHAVSDSPLPSAGVALTMRERSFSYVATLALYDSFIRYLEKPSRLDDPFLRETVTQRELDRYEAAGFLDASAVMDSIPQWRSETDSVTANVGQLHEQGVRIVLGTDVGNPMVFPGFTVHEELGHLVKAGLTPREALASGGLRAAEMLGREAEFGTIEVGKRADLVVLGADPLSDIGNTRSIREVVARGRVVDRPSLFPRN